MGLLRMCYQQLTLKADQNEMRGGFSYPDTKRPQLSTSYRQEMPSMSRCRLSHHLHTCPSWDLSSREKLLLLNKDLNSTRNVEVTDTFGWTPQVCEHFAKGFFWMMRQAIPDSGSTTLSKRSRLFMPQFPRL